MAKKATAATIELRVTDVYRRLLQNDSREEICQYASKKWKVDARTVDRYIARAKKLISDQALSVQTEEMGLARARLNLIFGMALKARDYRTALAAQKDLSALAGLNPPQGVAVTFPQLDPELEAYMQERGMTIESILYDLAEAVREIKAGTFHV